MGATAGEALDPAKALTQYKNDRWQTDQGLPQNTVQALLQTRDGYLWVGTLDGLARFDGVRFTRFDSRSTPELGLGSVHGLMEDSEGNLWIGRSDGASIFRDGRFRVVLNDDVTGGDSVWAFCQGPDGAVWAATHRGLVRWEKGAVRSYRRADGLPTDRLRSLAFDHHGTLWIGTTGGGLVSFSGGRFRVHGPAEGVPKENIQAVAAAPDGDIWAATAGGGLVHGRRGTFRTWTTADGLPTNQLSALALDSSGTLWIGTWGAGLCRMRQGRFDTLSSAGGLSGDQIWSLLADREGSLWVGTWVAGLNRLRNRHFGFLGAPEGLSHDNVRTVLRTEDGAMWVATAGGGLNRVLGDRITTLRAQDGLPSDETSALCTTRDGSLWIGTYVGGAARLHRGRLTRYGVAEGLPGPDVRVLYEDRKGVLWAGTMSGLARFDGRRFVHVTHQDVPLDRIVTILEDRQGTLWFGTTRKGLVRLRSGRFETLTQKDGLPSDRILALYEDDAGNLWIGTGGKGICRMKADVIKTIGPAQGLWDGIVQTILEDRRGQFWMTCNRGFFSVLRADLEAVAEGRLARLQSRGFGPMDALRSTTFAGSQQPSGAVDRSGRLWLPTYKGLVLVDPADLPGTRPPPMVLLEEVEVLGRTRVPATTVELPPGSQPLAIRFTAATLVDADRVHFRYWMEGLHGDWIDAGSSREAFIPGLPHGQFRFRVAASYDGRSWREAAEPLRVTVRPHYYQTPWFFGLVVLGVLAGAGMLVRLRTHQLRRLNERMRRLVEEKTKELHQANAHLSRLSFQDALTGLANRRRFDEVLDEEWRRAHRHRTPLALLMADVDAFKAYNDTLGHPEGDRCLATVGALLLHAVGRAGDLAARYGGEEFAILVPNAGQESARSFAEALRLGCELLEVPHPLSPVGPVVTLSLGVASMVPVDGLSKEDLLAAADGALYQAKQAGRNRVVTAEPGG